MLGVHNLVFFTDTLASGISGLVTGDHGSPASAIDKNLRLGTLFSMAVLSFMTSMVLDLTLRVASALWAANAINELLHQQGASGLTTQAMQQGGIGLLMTTLLITAPAMAASFFGGRLGQFQPFSQMGGASGPARQGAQGQAPGTYAPPPPQSTRSAPPTQTTSRGLGSHLNNSAGISKQKDAVRVHPSSPN